MKILPQIYMWTRKNWRNFGSHTQAFIQNVVDGGVTGEQGVLSFPLFSPLEIGPLKSSLEIWGACKNAPPALSWAEP